MLHGSGPFMNSVVSQSSNSGLDGVSLCIPKSSAVATSPIPKYACHIRLTAERAVVGERLSTNHRANSRREPGVGESDAGEPSRAIVCRKAGVPALTVDTGFS